MKNEKNKALLYIHIAVFLWGFTGIAGALISLNTFAIVWWRILLCTIILLPFTFKKILSIYKFQKTNFNKAIILGLVLSLHWICFYGSLKLSNISIAVVCLSLSSFFTALIELIFHKKVNLYNFIICTLPVLGIGLMFGFESQYRLGILIGILASLCNAIIPIYNKKIIIEIGAINTFIIEIFSGLITLTIAIFFIYGINGFEINQINYNHFIMLLILSIFLTIVPFYLAYDALKFIEPFTENIIINLEPVYTVTLAFIFFNEGEKLGFGFYFGVSLILLTVILQTYLDYNNKNKLTK